MEKISLILSPMPGSKYYAKKGLKKTITVFVNKETYDGLVKRARENEWSLQTFIRRTLDAVSRAKTEKPPNSF